ncbi:MAG: Nif3-like dinuclear metal center hexameric protein [Flavobacteriales bacterium]|nr:Nif3-like dinuclear metal center hexameric protein [Flavobacteriales bacterium]
MNLSDIIRSLEDLAPPELQASYDNAGLITGHPDDPVQGILVSLDCTEAVVDEAIQKGVNLIVSHHPLVFEGMKTFTADHYVTRALLKAIRHNIALYAIHTNLDAVADGVNGMLAGKLGLNNPVILQPDGPGSLTGSGMIGELSSRISEMEFMSHVKHQLEVPCLRHSPITGKMVKRVAICGGSGGFLLDEAIRRGADVMVTADLKYHGFFDADGKILLVDAGHFETEQFTQDLIVGYLKEKFPNFAVLFKTETNTNPVNYLV